jgi:hypothetical protein
MDQNPLLYRNQNFVFSITSSSNTISKMIGIVEARMKGVPYQADLIKQLKQMRSNAFDPYSSVELLLDEYGVKIIFNKSGPLGAEGVMYTIQSLRGGRPCKDLAAKPGFFARLFA